MPEYRTAFYQLSDTEATVPNTYLINRDGYFIEVVKTGRQTRRDYKIVCEVKRLDVLGLGEAFWVYEFELSKVVENAES